ncbi:MAG: phage tail tape measure protein [Lepagella sp.]
MIDNLSGPMAGVASKVGANVSKLDAVSEGLGSMAKTGAVMQEMGNQITGAVLAPVEATFETRRALGELASLGVQDLGVVEDAARSFSDQWAGTTKSDFISAAYDIKSGIASLTDEGVAQYTELAGVTAKATKSTIGEMTSLFATGYGIYKEFYGDLSDIEFGEMFSAGISQSVKQFKTTGSGMAQSIQTLGASATTANVPLEEQLSILGMLQATMSGSEAGTKYKAFLRSAAKGGEALGLSFTDANNQLLSMPEILDKLRGKFGDTIDAAEKMELQKAFGDTESVALIDLMYNKVGDLQNNIVGMYSALGSGTGVATEMASAINETEPEKFERLQQRIHNVTETIGNTLLPTVNDLMGKGEQVLTKVGSWIDQHQELVRIIMIVVLALGGFLTVGGTLIAVIGGVGLIITKAISAFKMLKAGLLLAKGALTPLISSVWGFTAALLANPVTWVVIGIVALIAALVLLYNKCEWFRHAVNAGIDILKEKLGAALDVAKSIFGAIGNVIGSVMEAAKTTVSERLSNMKAAYQEHGGGIRGIAAAAVEGVKGYYTAGFTFLDNLTGGKLTAIREKFSTAMSGIVQGVSQKFTEARAAFSNGLNTIKNAVSGAVTWFFQSGRRIVSTFASGIRSAFSGAVDTVKNGLQRIRNLLPFSDAKEGPLSTLTLSGQRTMTTYAHGLTLAKNAPAEAMEKGLEQTKATLEREPPKKVNLMGGSDQGDGTDESGARSSSGGKTVIIQRLLMQVDLKKIKDLQTLLALLKEVEDFTNGNGDEDPSGDSDAVPTPA